MPDGFVFVETARHLGTDRDEETFKRVIGGKREEKPKKTKLEQVVLNPLDEPVPIGQLHLILEQQNDIPCPLGLVDGVRRGCPCPAEHLDIVLFGRQMVRHLRSNMPMSLADL